MALYDKGVVHFCTRLFSLAEKSTVKENSLPRCAVGRRKNYNNFLLRKEKIWKQKELEKKPMSVTNIRQEKVWKM